MDGNSHEHQYFEDRKRENRLEKNRITFLRFSDLVVKKNMFSVEIAVTENVDEWKGHSPNPSLMGVIWSTIKTKEIYKLFK